MAVILLFGSGRDDWKSLFLSEPQLPFDEAPPAFVMSGTDSAFPAECGDEAVDVGSSGGYAPNFDIERHTIHAIAIVEGTVRKSGPARFGNIEYRSVQNAPGSISTPFVIEVSKTHKGPTKTEWQVSERGGLVGCVSYRISADGIRLFDGAVGLFFISAETRGATGDGVLMAIVEDAPEWYYFTASRFGSIEDAVEIIENVE